MRIRNPFVVSIAFLLLFAFESAAPVAHADAVKRVIKVITRSDLAAKKAEETFLAHNFRLVAHMAHTKHKAINRRGSLGDLMQQGNIGMLEAFRKFDPTRGFKFSTFATWYINQKISEWSYEQIGSIRVPTHRWRDKRRVSSLSHARAMQGPYPQFVRTDETSPQAWRPPR